MDALKSKSQSIFVTEDTLSSLQWRVIHLPYPRETQEHSCLGITWILWKKIKIPKFFIQKKRLEKQTASVNHDLLCQQIENLLNSEETQEYDLFSISTTYSGSFSISQAPIHPHHQFLKRRSPTGMLLGKEALIVILKRKANRNQ